MVYQHANWQRSTKFRRGVSRIFLLEATNMFLALLFKKKLDRLHKIYKCQQTHSKLQMDSYKNVDFDITSHFGKYQAKVPVSIQAPRTIGKLGCRQLSMGMQRKIFITSMKQVYFFVLHRIDHLF